MSWLVLLVIPVVAFIIGFLGSLSKSTARSVMHNHMTDQFLDNAEYRRAVLNYLLKETK